MKNKAQALTELAIFGSILLFCVAMLLQFGLQANYQQEVQMESFRKAQQMAFNKRGPGATSSLVVVKNKAYPDPRDKFGFAESSPISADSSVVWDTDQSAQYVKKFEDQPDKGDLPAIYFNVEKVDLTQLNNTLPASQRPNVPKMAGQNDTFGFYTARYEKRACSGSVTVVFEDRKHTKGTEYVTKTIPCSDIRVARLEGGFGSQTPANIGTTLLMSPYYRSSSDSPIQKITDADVDGDGQLERVIAADASKTFLYIDYHDKHGQGSVSPSATVADGGAIQIDSLYAQVGPEDKECLSWDESTQTCKSWRYLQPADRQGMIQDYEKSVKYNENRITKTEEEGTITSKTTLNAEQKVTQKFRLNNGQVVEIPVELKKSGVYYNWPNN